MWIRPHKNQDFDLETIAWYLRQAVEASRFTARVSVAAFRSWERQIWAVRIEVVRLRNRKLYCGQHPGPCVVNPFLGIKKHPNSARLEGADWVGWNDGINDVLDRLNLDANAWSANREAAKPGRKGNLVGVSRYFIRKGRCRRILYDAEFHTNSVGNTFAHWTEGHDCDYEDYCGQMAPRARYEDGTPGLACWTLEEEKELLSSLEHVH
jgi:hypothetical protein